MVGLMAYGTTQQSHANSRKQSPIVGDYLAIIGCRKGDDRLTASCQRPRESCVSDLCAHQTFDLWTEISFILS